MTQYTCPDCDFKTKFSHWNTSLAELRKHRERERAMSLHPAGKMRWPGDNLSTGAGASILDPLRKVLNPAQKSFKKV